MPTQEFRSLLEAEVRKAELHLPPAALDRIEAHYRLLVKWNRAVRLVGDLDPATLVHRHVLESLALLPYLQERRGSLLDIGSGNGFPAIPLKCVLDELRVGMMEPTERKSLFLATVVRELGLTDCDVIRARVDRPKDLARWGRWDCITIRAVAALPALLMGGGSALRPGGRILFMVGEAGRQEILARLAPPLELIASNQLPNSRASFIVVVGLPSTTGTGTVH
jgi:16S rRNA (guanine527-N7)-methyltransferase